MQGSISNVRFGISERKISVFTVWQTRCPHASIGPDFQVSNNLIQLPFCGESVRPSLHSKVRSIAQAATACGVLSSLSWSSSWSFEFEWVTPNSIKTAPTRPCHRKPSALTFLSAPGSESGLGQVVTPPLTWIRQSAMQIYN